MVKIFIVGIALADIAAQPVHRQVHLGQAHGFGYPLLAVDADGVTAVFTVLLDKAGTLHKHAAGAAGRVEDAPPEGLDNAHDQLDDAGGRKKFAAALPLAHGEFAQKILVDLAEGIAFDVHRDGAHQPEQLGEGGVIQAVVALRQNIL